MKKIITFSLLMLLLTGCAETTAIKSPCHYSGTNCLPRTKINQWDN